MAFGHSQLALLAVSLLPLMRDDVAERLLCLEVYAIGACVVWTAAATDVSHNNANNDEDDDGDIYIVF